MKKLFTCGAIIALTFSLQACGKADSPGDKAAKTLALGACTDYSMALISKISGVETNLDKAISKVDSAVLQAESSELKEEFEAFGAILENFKWMALNVDKANTSFMSQSMDDIKGICNTYSKDFGSK